jgi:uncharacterized membrane protein YfcA
VNSLEALLPWLLYLFTGVFAGFLAGLLGIGGGMIIVPALILSFHWQGLTPEVSTHLAVGTSLASIVLTATSSIRTHHQKGGVDWSVLKRFVPALMLGALLGAQIAHQLPARILQLVIGVFALWTGWQMLKAQKPDVIQQPLPTGAPLFAAGGVIGVASAIFGIGGGSLMVPYLCHHGVRIQRAVGTAAAAGFPIALAGSAGFVISGWGLNALPSGATGYVYWPALLGIALTSLIFAHFGASTAHKLPAAKLKRAFGIVLVLVGIRFVIGIG